MRLATLVLALRFALPFWGLVAVPASAQQAAGDCPYPILFLHGFTGSQASWEPFTGHPAVTAIWGPRADVFHAVLNAYENEERIAGPDGAFDTADDDVLVQFVNEDNVLAPGCVYANNFENFWNEDPGNPTLEQNGSDSPGGTFATESDSNEEAALKQGYVLGRMIARVLEANPDKDRVILVGHSMGGLTAREYLQRRNDDGTPRWWVDPAAPDGHRVAKLLTVGTPHRGSNFFGNPFPLEDAIPDINSSATRDLRYNYFCLFCSSPGPYLFGGNEGNGFGWHTDDINCDGDDDDFVAGINIDGRDQGFDDPWDGTTDNPAFPLPTDVRYTWLTSDNGGSGDDIVDLARQWLYDGATPVPSDGVPYRLADTLLTDVFHLDQQEDTDAVIRGLDEPDYPAHAYGLDLGVIYAGTVTIRSSNAPDGAPTGDPDWYVVETGGGQAGVVLFPAAGRGGRLDLYDAPPDPYGTGPSAAGMDFPPGQRRVVLRTTLTAGTHYVRVRHDGVGATDWQQPYRLMVRGAPPAAAVAATASAATGDFALEANAPNPFRRQTALPYRLPAEGHVTLAVYDALGRRVAVLVDGVQAAGEHRAVFDAGDLPSGVYLARLDAAGQSATRRLLLVR